ncbi:MAG TPA: DUF47 family protein [Oculatellaceae cyanobacterium]
MEDTIQVVTGKKKESWLHRLLEPKTNFYLLLQQQAETTLNGMIALEEYMISGAKEPGQKVRELEKFADHQKLGLERKLVDSFVTPFDREDIYDVSTYMDEIINAAKATVRETEAMQLVPGAPIYKEMAGTLVEGTRAIHGCLHQLNQNIKEAATHAQQARKSENRFNNTYREAMADLYSTDDVKQILKTTEVLRCMMNAAVRIDRLGEKLLHVIVKLT